MSNRELETVSVGPFSLDLVLARALGYTEAELAAARAAMTLLARGAQTTREILSGRQCSHCGGRPALDACGACEIRAEQAASRTA